MSRPDEQHLKEEAEVVEGTSEDGEESPEAEGHIWLRDADNRAADPSTRFRAS